MKNRIKLILLFINFVLLSFALDKTLTFYNSTTNFKNNFSTENYNFSIDSSGGTFSNDKVVINGVSATLPIPYRKGYDFIGFSSSKDGAVKYSNNISNVENINNSKLYTKWKVITYSISYDLNGGSITNQPRNYTVEDSYILPAPSKRGYTFAGWSGTGISGLSKSVTISKGSIGNREYKANWSINTYSISYNLNGGTISGEPTSYNINDTYTLPTPSKKGYTFTGWSGTGINGTSKNVTVSGDIGNKTYTANWSQNYYTVYYYVNGSLWTTRSVGYGNSIENLNVQSLLDNYHAFHGWNNWVDTMPDYNISLTANITESYCALITGHGPYGNATALLKVFQDAGWSGRVEIAPSTKNYYWVVTDYTLTRAQAEIQKDYIARHTNYKNYNFPYLYWVAVDCTNGYSESWTRSSGQLNFN